MNKKLKRFLPLILILVMVMGSIASVSAAGLAFYDGTTKTSYSPDMTDEELDELIAAIEAGNNVSKLVGDKLVNYKDYKDAITAVILEAIENEEDITAAVLAKMNDIVAGLEEQEGPGEEPGELEVIEISAIDSTTIRVLFSNGIESNFTVDPLKDGSNTVKFIYDGVEYTGTVNWVAKAAVESVEFDNYRQIRVTFNTVVDEATATDPYNYYFEIVEGDVAGDTFGLLPTLQDHNQLKDIETAYVGWWDDHITAETVNGKTEVTINFPEDARFTNRVDGLSATNVGTGGLATDEVEDGSVNDDERTLRVVLSDGVTLKSLVKNTNVVVNVRNVKNADGIRNIDTSRHEILIQDTKNPNLVEMRRVRDEKVFTKEITVYSDGSDVIEFEYDEPVFDAHDLETIAIDRDVRVYVNGKYAGGTKALYGLSLAGKLDFAMAETDSYDESRIATLNVQAIALDAIDKAGNPAAEPFIDGEQLVITVIGVTDLAGNIQVPSSVEIIVNVEDKPTGPSKPSTKPEVLGIKQVTDNIFRVEFNRVDATGEFYIENADGENGKIEKYQLPLSADNGNGKFYSYVVVDAIDVDSYGGFGYDDPNAPEDDILAYDGQTQLDRTVRVRDVWAVDSGNYSQKGDNYKKEMFPIVKDTLAPKIVSPAGGYKVDHDDASVAARTLTLSVKDIFPNSWTGEYANPVKALIYDYDNNIAGVAGVADIDRNVIVAFGEDGQLTAKRQYLPIKVSYITDAGVTRSAVLFNGPKGLPDNQDHNALTPISYSIANGELTLNLTGYTSLLDNDTNELVKGATYKVEMLKGFFADPELEDVDNQGSVNDTDSASFTSQVTWADDQQPQEDLATALVGTPATFAQITTPIGLAGFEVLHVSEARTLDAAPVIGKGYSSKEQVVLYKIGEKPASEETEGLVPQTSKEMIKYDQDTNEMSIEFKGEIDVATLKKAANYTLNGKTLAAWGTKDSQIVFKQEVNALGDVTAQYAIFEVPQDSVPRDGDVQIIVEGVKNKVGGTMTQVIADVALLDNTRPVVTKAVKQGDNQIILTFDEPLEFKEGSNQFTAAKNFIMKINGVEMQGSVLEARLVDGERKVTLQLGIDITATTGDIVIEIVEDASNNINIIDQAKHKNPLKDGYPISVTR